MLFWIHHCGEYQEKTTHNFFQVWRWFVPLFDEFLPDLSFLVVSLQNSCSAMGCTFRACQDSGCLLAQALLAAVCRLQPHHSFTFGSSVSVNCTGQKAREIWCGKRGDQRTQEKYEKKNDPFSILNPPCPSLKYFSMILCLLDSEVGYGHSMMLLGLSFSWNFVWLRFVFFLFFFWFDRGWELRI